MNRKKTTKTMWSTARPLGLFAVAVLALSAGVPFEVRSADNQAAIEESDAKMAGLIGPLMNEAITLFRAGKYEQALSKCNEIDKVFATQNFVVSSQLTGQKSMISQLRSEIQAKWGAVLMQDLRTAYAEALNLLANDRALREKMGRNNLITIQRFSIETVNEELRNIYESELSKIGGDNS